MDLSGMVVAKGTVPCRIEAVMDLLARYVGEVTVGVESTYNWYWLLDGLQQQGVPCLLGHALYMKRNMSSKHKNDPVDSRAIADLLRCNRFPLAYAYPRDMRTVRDMLRRRHFFVCGRAGTFTHFLCSLHQDGYIEPLRNKLQYKCTRGSLARLGSNADLRKMLSVDLDYIKSLDGIVEDLDKTILERAERHNPKHLRSLQTIPGCGKICALTILYETHRISRFRSPQAYSSYSRVVRADNQSAGKDLGRSTNDKIGNPHLKWAFSEIGSGMVRVSPPVQRWRNEQATQHGTTGAHARFRHKIAVTVYHMLKHDRVFDLEKFVGKQYMDAPARPPTTRTNTASKASAEASPVEEPAPSMPLEPVETAAVPDARKRRGRPPLPRDARGRIIRPSRTQRTDQPVSPAHNRTVGSGPQTEPSQVIEPPAGPSSLPPPGGKPDTTSRAALQSRINGLTDEDLRKMLEMLDCHKPPARKRGRPPLRTTGDRMVLTECEATRC